MSGFDDYRDLCEERDQLRAELEAAKQDAAKCAAAHINAVSACNENAHLLTKASAELAELRARVPAICFPRQPNGEDGWVIDANYVAAIHKDCFPIEWQPCEEEVEAVLLAVERAAPVTPAAVPDDVAKDAERYRFLKERSPFGNRVPHIEQYPYQPKIDRSEFPHFTVVGIDEAIDAAILAAKEKGQ